MHAFDQQIRGHDMHFVLRNGINSRIVTDPFDQVGLLIFEVFGQMFDQPKLP